MNEGYSDGLVVMLGALATVVVVVGLVLVVLLGTLKAAGPETWRAAPAGSVESTTDPAAKAVAMVARARLRRGPFLGRCC